MSDPESQAQPQRQRRRRAADSIAACLGQEHGHIGSLIALPLAFASAVLLAEGFVHDSDLLGIVGAALIAISIAALALASHASVRRPTGH